MKNIGILGGSRFIGYHLAHGLLKLGHRVTLFNRGLSVPPAPFPPSVNYVFGDRNKPSDVINFLADPYDVVFDLSGYTVSHVQPLLTRDCLTKIRHYIFCSSSSVYKIPPPYTYTEEAPRSLRPNTYGGDKALIENLLLGECRTTGWPVTILRPQGVFGPFDPARQARFVFSRLKNSLPILLGSRQEYKINFLYVTDLITIFTVLMNNSVAYGKTYNVAGDDTVDQQQFATLCSEVSALPAQIRIVDDTRYRHLAIGIPWLDYHLVPDNSKIKHDLRHDFIPLKVALAATWEWLQTSPEDLIPRSFEGEEYLRENRPIPFILDTYWRLNHMAKSSRIRQRVVSPIIRSVKRRFTL